MLIYGMPIHYVNLVSYQKPVNMEFVFHHFVHSHSPCKNQHTVGYSPTNTVMFHHLFTEGLVIK